MGIVGRFSASNVCLGVIRVPRHPHNIITNITDCKDRIGYIRSQRQSHVSSEEMEGYHPSVRVIYSV